MKHLPYLFLGVFAAVAISGCASAPSRFYTLNSSATAGDVALANCAVVVGPVFLPAAVDRPQFTVIAAPNRVELNEFNRWAGPLGEGIARVVSTDLGVLLGSSHVASAPVPDFGPAYHVTIRVERFESVRGDAKRNGEALVDALWVIRNPAGDNVGSGHTLAREPAVGDSFDALAAAHSRAIGKLSGDIASAIRAELAKPATK